MTNDDPQTQTPDNSLPPEPPFLEFPVEVERDDSIVGRAFLWSTLAIVLAGTIGGVTVWRMSIKPKPAELKTPLAKAQVRERSSVPIPNMPFEDITESAGIQFVHENGAAGEKLLPESMGGGVAFLDYDGDNDPDILFVNSCRWPWDGRPASSTPTMALYRNDGDCKFTDVTRDAGLDLTFYGQGVAVGDFDNDGDVDLFLTAVGQNKLLRNDGSKFVDVSTTAGVAGSPKQWSTSCGFVDYDNDGDLDLFVCNYVKWTREFDKGQPFTLTGGERGYGRPQDFPGTYPYLYRNEGNGTFTEVSDTAGLRIRNPVRNEIYAGKSLGVTFADFDSDGWIDIAVANDTVQNFLFHNQQDGMFAEKAIERGVAFDQQGQARGAMGIDVARIRNSDHVAIVIGNFANEMSALYVASGKSMQFNDEAIATGLGPQTRLELTFGTLFADVDLDGRLDIVAANGHLENEINKVQASQFYEQPPHFFWNCGPESRTEFAPVPSEKCGSGFLKRMVGRGAAIADIDGDGDLDVLFGATGSKPRLLRNDQKLENHWLRLDVSGVHGSRSAIGARIELQTESGKMQSQVMPTRGYLSQSELIVTFGLGKQDKITSVTVTWPTGEKKTIDAPAVDQVLKVAP
ncbi:MAG: CRTAC1 family protein [Planctomycetes bacterium]|nr:CRTAC1 family protein [Planctomycetota bacterium]